MTLSSVPSPAHPPTHPLARLRDRIDRITAGRGIAPEPGTDAPHSLATPIPPAPIGIPEIDAAIGGGLARGALHEFIGHADHAPDRAWSPALGLLTHIARAVAGAAWVVWIGPGVWPSGHALTLPAGEAPALRERSVFVDARAPADRLWAADVALRCGADGAIGAIVVDASAFDIGATRRLQLAARRDGAGRTVALLARPPAEARSLSVAHSRWTTQRHPCATDPGWIVACVRCKGLHPRAGARWTWAVEWRCAKGDVRVGADVADRSRAPEADPRWGVAAIA